MGKINSIQLNNYKFFSSSVPIVIDGKHLLLYGENGSGKSSLCAGINTIFQAGAKSVNSIKSIFELPTVSQKSEVNIYADVTNGPDHTGSFIRLCDDMGNIYKLSHSDLDVCTNRNIVETNLASDFINYQSLFRFQIPHNNVTSSLIDVFEYSIFPHLSFPQIVYHGKEYRNAMSMIQAYKKGPGFIENDKGKTILVYKHSQEYQEYLMLESHINEHIQRLIDFINANIYEKIKHFEYDFKVNLTYVPAEHDKKDTWLDKRGYDIRLSLTEYEGKAVVVNYPSRFLNEARMTALSFCIRWCVLDYRIDMGLAPDAMKVLLLDDVMISLDRCNRTKLIQIILDHLCNEFQILFFTHDRSIYSYMLKELMIRNNISKEEELLTQDIGWCFCEMFACKRDDHRAPLIQPYDSPYSKAKHYYEGDGCMVDFSASGNSLRNAFECALKNILLRLDVNKNTDGTPIRYDNVMLADLIKLARTFFPQKNISLDIINEIDGIKNILLNPTSHYNPETDFYGQELEKAFGIYEKLSQCEIKTIVPKGEEMQINIPKADGNVYEYHVTCKKDIKAYKVYGAHAFCVLWEPMKCSFTFSEDRDGKVHNENKLRVDDFYNGNVDYVNSHGGLAPGYEKNPLKGITYNGHSLDHYL